MSPLVGCPGLGDFCPGVLLSGGSFARGTFSPGDFFPGGLLPGGTFVRGAYARSSKFNAYTYRLGFLCLAS